jgi:hypothetical protein
MDYQKELENYPDAPEEEKAELAKLASLQKDIAISGSAEDFIRHPFFKTFENHLNDAIADTKGAFLKIEDMASLQAYKARIEALQELKQWLNSKVMAGRIAKQAIDIYEQDTAEMSEKIQAAIDQSQPKA